MSFFEFTQGFGPNWLNTPSRATQIREMYHIFIDKAQSTVQQIFNDARHAFIDSILEPIRELVQNGIMNADDYIYSLSAQMFMPAQPDQANEIHRAYSILRRNQDVNIDTLIREEFHSWELDITHDILAMIEDIARIGVSYTTFIQERCTLNDLRAAFNDDNDDIQYIIRYWRIVKQFRNFPDILVKIQTLFRRYGTDAA
jgi:hypothetical protein